MNSELEIFAVDSKTLPKQPSEFNYKLSDISGSDAGRTQDTTMHKNRIGQKRSISVAWINLDRETLHTLYAMFNPEYVDITFWDPLEGVVITRTFYTGDKDSPMKQWTVGRKRYSRLSFDLIER